MNHQFHRLNDDQAEEHAIKMGAGVKVAASDAPRSSFTAKWAPPPSLAGQWSAFAYGMKYHTAGVLEKALSYLIFILLVLPIAALIFVLCGLFQLCRARPVVRLFSRGCQRLGVRLMRGGLQHLYLGLLIQRVRFFFDFLFTCRVGLEYAAYVEATGTARGFVCFNGLYVGGYDDCRAIIMDPQRRRGLTLGSSILATPRSFDPCMPTFFDTGSKYHTAWRRCFDDEIAGRDALSTALINNAALFRSQAQPFVDAWLATAEPHAQPAVAACVFKLIMRSLFGVTNPDDVPEGLVAAVVAFSSTLGTLGTVVPSWSHDFPLCGVTQAKYQEPARHQLAAFLLAHCSADAPRDDLKGAPFSWARMAAECDVGAPQFVQSVVDAILFAGVIGTTTLVHLSALPRLRGVNKPRWPTRVAAQAPQPSRDAYQAMYRADSTAWILEAVRLQPPVQSTGKLLPTDERCPFMHGDVTLPRGSSVVACLYYASVDKAAWGDDADAFKPGRPKERHLNWNGPFGGDAPRKCPGEQLSFELGRVMLDGWMGSKHAVVESVAA